MSIGLGGGFGSLTGDICFQCNSTQCQHIYDSYARAQMGMIQVQQVQQVQQALQNRDITFGSICATTVPPKKVNKKLLLLRK